MSDKIQKAVAAKEKALATKPEQKSMMEFIAEKKTNIAQALPPYINIDRFIRIVGTAMTTNPELMRCTKRSFYNAVLLSAQLGLEPNTPTGQAYLIPYNTKQGMMCQFQIGYKGYVALAYRSGEVASIHAHTVCENDNFEMTFGLNPVFRHSYPLSGERGKAVGYWAMFRTTRGDAVYDYMSLEEMQAHAKTYAQSFNSTSSPWKSAFDEMAKKTVLRRVLKLAPLSAEVNGMLAQDGAIREIEDPDDITLEPTIESEFTDETEE